MQGKNKKLLIIGLIVLAVGGVSFLLESFVVFPSYSGWNQNQDQLKIEKQTAEKITNSVAILNSLDKNKIASIKAFLDTLIPEQFDSFHFASLNEVVSAAAGSTITSLTITKGAGGAKTATGVGQTSQKVATVVNISYTSDFDTLLRLIKYWFVADRLVGPTQITITGKAGSSILSYTISYQLPLAPVTPVATVDDNLSLTPVQISKLEELRSSIIYTATPSAKPVGKDNPFQ